MRIGAVAGDAGSRLVAEVDGELVAIREPSGWPGLFAAGASPELGEKVPAARLTTPIRPGKIVAIGLNYLDHIRETGADAPKEPLVFTKLISSVVGPTDPVVMDTTLTEQVDWEVELAVVIGTKARNVPVDDALAYVFGYTVANDVSARDLQFSDGQWVRDRKSVV